MRIACALTLITIVCSPTLAQEAWLRSSSEAITPRGTRTDRVTTMIAPWGGDDNRTMATGETRWTHTDGGRAYIPSSVAIGDRGAVSWVGESLNAERFQLFSSTATGPVEPVWFDDGFGPSRGDLIVAAASQNDRAVGIVHHADPSGGWIAEVRSFVSSAGQPQWTRMITPASATVVSFVAVSEEGDRVVLARQDTSSGRTRVMVLAGETGQKLFERRLIENDIRALGISRDASRIYVASSHSSFVLDGNDGRTLISVSNFGGFASHGLSGDGRTFAFGGFNVIQIYRDSLGDGQFAPWCRETYPGKAYTAVCGFSDDGAHLAWATVHYERFSRYDVFSYDVSQRRVLFQTTFQAQGAAQDVPQRIRFARDRSRFAIGGWGDEANAHAEVQVFDVGNANPVFEIDTVGSVFDVSLDPAGERAVAAAKSVHANRLGNGGEVIARELRETALDLRGVFRIGSSVELRAKALPGSTLSLAFSSGHADPTPVPGCEGQLWLELGSTILLDHRTVPASGQLAWPVMIPSSAGRLLGRRFVTQFLEIDRQLGCRLSSPVFARVLP